ncbi:MAG: L,D-transpeptidase [Caldibacillus debilis]|uniref:L,D-transpeptidase n=2 Tax=Caldibacillus debilis TaxID=301148 RepID=A0A3E0K276_9BACI|nr:L,D-transpeptidase [Caldibacillus debilis]REJ27222.1 MAG: L,D-transpeptidase [Caldibacillus debilis]
MKSAFLTLFFTLSPLWPLGPNPLPGDPLVIVNLNTNRVAFIHGGEVQEIYLAATGKWGQETPEGLFTVTVKVINPYYRKLNIPGGAKTNPLGSRWIGFDAYETDGRKYGIHGTNRPELIGGYVSQGCIRLPNEDIERLYEKVPLGTKIFITRSDKTFRALGAELGAIPRNGNAGGAGSR